MHHFFILVLLLSYWIIYNVYIFLVQRRKWRCTFTLVFILTYLELNCTFNTFGNQMVKTCCFNAPGWIQLPWFQDAYLWCFSLCSQAFLSDSKGFTNLSKTWHQVYWLRKSGMNLCVNNVFLLYTQYSQERLWIYWSTATLTGIKWLLKMSGWIDGWMKK